MGANHLHLALDTAPSHLAKSASGHLVKGVHRIYPPRWEYGYFDTTVQMYERPVTARHRATGDWHRSGTRALANFDAKSAFTNADADAAEIDLSYFGYGLGNDTSLATLADSVDSSSTERETRNGDIYLRETHNIDLGFYDFLQLWILYQNYAQAQAAADAGLAFSCDWSVSFRHTYQASPYTSMDFQIGAATFSGEFDTAAGVMPGPTTPLTTLHVGAGSSAGVDYLFSGTFSGLTPGFYLCVWLLPIGSSYTILDQQGLGSYGYFRDRYYFSSLSMSNFRYDA